MINKEEEYRLLSKINKTLEIQILYHDVKKSKRLIKAYRQHNEEIELEMDRNPSSFWKFVNAKKKG